MQAQLTNLSQTQFIFVALKPPDDASIPPKNQMKKINPNSSLIINVGSGIMNLFVWGSDSIHDSTLELIWSGVVPTKVRKAITIDPERKEVLYNNLRLPSGFVPVTDISNSLLFTTQNNSYISSNLILCVILFIIIFLGLYFYFKK